jgi:two-component system response regulator DevR
MERVRVFLSDPQVLFREGIHFILSGEDEFEVTGEATGNEEALAFIEVNPPNIAMLSMQDSKLPGPEVTRRIKRGFPAVSVMLTMEKKEEAGLFTAIKSGASACLTKDIDPKCLLDTITDVARGGCPVVEDLLMPGLASLVLSEFEDLATLNEKLDNLLARPAPKEQKILSNIAAGYNLEQVIFKMGTSEETIRHNLKSVLNKLVLNEQARALIEAAQRSLPSIIRGLVNKDGSGAEYITRAEFTEFKDSLMERLKSFAGELA